jgi:hypothetical protein
MPKSELPAFDAPSAKALIKAVNGGRIGA